MKRLMWKLFGIQEGEEAKALLMFLYIFLIIASLLIVKPVRNSLFITHVGVSKLPFAFIAVAICAALITQIYSTFINKFRLNILIAATIIISIGCLVFFWVLLFLNNQNDWFFYCFYVWVAIFGAITTSQFWLLANYVFNVREAKRLFGFVGAGAISGGIFGGYATKFLAPVIGTHYMIFIGAGFLSICIVILRLIWKKSARVRYSEQREQEKRLIKTYAGDNALRLILKSRHLAYLTGITGISVIVANLVDYQFIAVSSNFISDGDRLTAFFGFWLSNLSIAALIVQFFLTGPVLRIFGVTFSLFFLPIGILIGAVSILFQPALWSAIVIKMSDGSFKQSMNKAGLELLALPLPTHIKNKVKAFIDVFVDSLAIGIGGILLILVTDQLGLSIQAISILIFALIMLWLLFIDRIRYEYIDAFRLALEKRSIDLSKQNVNLADSTIMKNLFRILDGSNERQILYVLQLIENVKNDRFLPYLKKLITHRSSEIKVYIFKIIQHYAHVDFTKEAHHLIDDHNYDVKVEAVCYLCRRLKFENKALEKFLNHRDYHIRCATLLCIAQEYKANSRFREQTDIKYLFERFVDQYSQENVGDEHIAFMKSNIANVIGTSSAPQLYPYLKNMLNDPDLKTVQAAIVSAGKTCDPMFIPSLIKYLKHNALQKYAREALVEYGEQIIDILGRHFKSKNEDKNIRLRIPRVLSSIGLQKSVNLLTSALNLADVSLRYESIRALNRLKINFPLLKFDKQHIRLHLYNEIEQHYEILTLLYFQNKITDETEPVALSNSNGNNVRNIRKLLIQALEEKLDLNLERIFRLLSLQFPPKKMYHSYLGIKSKKTDHRANAIEFLDDVLDTGLKRVIIPLVEENSYDELFNKTKNHVRFQVRSLDESFHSLLNGSDNWLKMCTIHFIAELRLEKFKDIIAHFIDSQDAALSESARYYMNHVFHDEAGYAYNS